MNPIFALLQSLHSNIMLLNENKFFAGIVMITLNLCSRFANFNISKSTENMIRENVTKTLLIFSVSWMGTRDIYTAILLTLTFTVIFDYLLNDESKYSIVPEKYKLLAREMDTNKDGIVSDDEIQRAITILEKARSNKIKKKQIGRAHV